MTGNDKTTQRELELLWMANELGCSPQVVEMLEVLEHRIEQMERKMRSRERSAAVRYFLSPARAQRRLRHA